MRTLSILIPLAAAAWGLAGCATGPDFQAPDPPCATRFGMVADGDKTVEAQGPGGGAQQFDAARQVPEKWWELFRHEALNAAVETALTNSPTLDQLAARLRQAQEEYNAQAGTARYPSMDAGLSASRQRVNPEAMGVTGIPEPPPFTLFNASVSVSYVLDLFGRNRRALEGLQAQVDQRAYAWAAARQTLAANVVATLIRQAGIQRQAELAGSIIAARTEQLDIARRRFESGGLSARELEGQGLALQQARAALPALEHERARLGRQLDFLRGAEPVGAGQDPLELDALHLPGELPAGVPSEAARQRPDIRMAEAVWRQACANVGVATANLYPRITLTGRAGSQRTDLADMLDRMNVWSIGGELAQPLFHGGALRAQKRAAVAAYEAAAAAYRETVLHGLLEVADALEALQADARILAARTAAANHARTALDIATRQQQDGAISHAALLEERIRHWQAEGDRVAVQAARLADTVALFQALGGGWDREPDEANAAKP